MASASEAVAAQSGTAELEVELRAHGGALSRRAIYLVIAIALSVTAASVVALAMREWLPAFDVALIWLRATDVGTLHTPLVGPYSRFGWDHPGPLLYFVMAAFLRAFALHPTGLLVGAVAINLAATAMALIHVIRRAGLTVGMVFAVAWLALSFGLGDRLISPWNPNILVLPFALFAVCAWLWADGQFQLAPLAVAAASFCVQNHVGVTVAVLAIGVAAIALRCIAPAPFTRAERRTLLASAALGVVLWLPPLIQEFTQPPGNLSRLLRFFTSHSAEHPALGWWLGLKTAASELLPWSSWLGFQRLSPLNTVEPAHALWLFVPVGMLLAASAMAARHRDYLTLRFVAVAAAGVVACIVSYANVRGLPLGYLATWPRVIATLCVAAPAIALARRRAVPATTRASALALVASVVAVLSVFGARAPLPDAHASDVHLKLAPAIASAVAPGTRIRVAGTGVPFTVSPEGVATVLLRAGRTAMLQPFDVNTPGPHRCVDKNERLPTLAITSGPIAEGFAPRPNGKLIAKYDPLSPEERTEVETIRRLLTRQLRTLHLEALIPQLYDGDSLAMFRGMPQLNRALIERYIELADGYEHRAYALYWFPDTTW